MLSICSLIRKAKQSPLLKINLWREEQILNVWLSHAHGIADCSNKSWEKREQLKIMKCRVTVNKRLCF